MYKYIYILRYVKHILKYFEFPKQIIISIYVIKFFLDKKDLFLRSIVLLTKRYHSIGGKFLTLNVLETNFNNSRFKSET